MSEIPYEVPQEWHDSLSEMREKVKLYPEDPEDQVIREYDARHAALAPEVRTKIRELVFDGELRALIDEAIDDPDLGT